MDATALFERALNDLADGLTVDWAELLRPLDSPELRARFEGLRIVQEVGRVHQSSVRPVDWETTPTTLPTAEAELLAGATWGRYRIVRKIGEGSYGAVYLARDPELETDVAIKILHRHLTDSQLKERLRQEGQALARVRHENVVRVIGIEHHEGRVGLVTEFVHGETLETAMKSLGRLNAREAAAIGEEMCRAVAAVHKAGLLHRDIKARNIMRDENGRHVLVDFGTFRRLDDTAGAVRREGTAFYMAPEVLARKPATIQSDVYSLGVLLYFLVSGRYPVEAGSMADLLAAHLQQQRTPLAALRPDLPMGFLQLVNRALEPNPESRWPSAAAMLQALGALVFTSGSGATWKRVGVAVASGLGLLMALGAVNSYYFDVTLGRFGFDSNTPLDWLTWGRISMTAPIIIFIGVVLILTMLNLCWQGVAQVCGPVRRAQDRAIAWAYARRLHTVSTLASLALLLSGVALVAVWAYSIPFLSALMDVPNISTAPSEALAFLSPKLRDAHDHYRGTLIGLVIWCVLVWIPPIWLQIRRGEAVNLGVRIGGVAVLTLALLLLDFPYRMLAWDKRKFQSAELKGERCYVLGEKGPDTLLFCPASPLPRNRIVSANDPSYKKTGEIEDIFEHIPVPPVLIAKFLN